MKNLHVGGPFWKCAGWPTFAECPACLWSLTCLWLPWTLEEGFNLGSASRRSEGLVIMWLLESTRRLELSLVWWVWLKLFVFVFFNRSPLPPKQLHTHIIRLKKYVWNAIWDPLYAKIIYACFSNSFHCERCMLKSCPHSLEMFYVFGVFLLQLSLTLYLFTL